ncbi:MAG: site-specific DNA-methyltransferase [Candidatus Omnitrophica bacterium CG11_big_fil_rev_8_21_14_0_20_42_13]|uniref:Methyltransferase n=1 Tax=Candidatus Ghiorseimicrobium undicola TaxID=1974746 RepID=A0A2H0LW93_9BACT|nr:MAG: site-specific DNA-methyltransferase [Candidatus Omnitrophica bacterium CG11_big_fil_rev_8_21_14_0_20_42_13]
METLFKAHKQIAKNFDENESIVLHLGDTLEFLKTLPSESISLSISSPPYNIGKVYEKKVEIEEYLSAQKPVISELVRTLKKDGSICWEIGNYVDKGEIFPLDIYYYDIFKEYGLKLRNRIIWHFGHGLHASKRFSGRYETILWFTKTDSYKFNLDNVRIPSKYPGKRHFKGKQKGRPSCNPLGKNPSDIWTVIEDDWDKEIWNIPNVKANHPEKTIHPCQFPIELVERCVLALTDQNDWVFDSYCGVGSALIAALKNDRRAIGCDKEEDYIKITEKRINDYYSGALKTRPIGKPIFMPTGREKVCQIPKEWKEGSGENEDSRRLLFQ